MTEIEHLKHIVEKFVLFETQILNIGADNDEELEEKYHLLMLIQLHKTTAFEWLALDDINFTHDLKDKYILWKQEAYRFMLDIKNNI